MTKRPLFELYTHATLGGHFLLKLEWDSFLLIFCKKSGKTATSMKNVSKESYSDNYLSFRGHINNNSKSNINVSKTASICIYWHNQSICIQFIFKVHESVVTSYLLKRIYTSLCGLYDSCSCNKFWTYIFLRGLLHLIVLICDNQHSASGPDRSTETGL